eukprot:1781656-Rhodomonas_salina.4
MDCAERFHGLTRGMSRTGGTEAQSSGRRVPVVQEYVRVTCVFRQSVQWIYGQASSPICLRSHYAMPGPEVAYDAVRCAVPRWCMLLLPLVCCAANGTDGAYAATSCTMTARP